MPDRQRLIAEVAARNGVRLDPHDPAFCLVTLSELILQEATVKVVAEIRCAAADFTAAAERLQTRSGTVLAQQLSGALSSARQCLREEIRATTEEATEKLERLHHSNARLVMYWISTAIVLAAASFIVGVFVGWTWR